VTLLAVVGWLVVGLAFAGAADARWVSLGAAVIAIAIPPVFHRFATAAALRLLHRLDPPSDDG